MSFLAPFYMAGLLAVSLPIAFHLLRRTPRGRMTFSSLMFLVPSPPKLTRRRRIEHWLLLLLRAAALCLIAAAFARPFLRRFGQIDLDATHGRRLAVLLDTSASMRRSDLWQRAVEQVEQIVANTGPADDLAVFAFDRNLRTLFSFEEWLATAPAARAEMLTERLAETVPTWAATHLDTALIAAADVLESTEAGENRNPQLRERRIVLISDVQLGSRIAGLGGFTWPQGVELEIRTVPAVEPTNVGLQWLRESPEAAEPDSDERPRIRITNADGAMREQFRLRWDRGSAADESAEGMLPVYVPAGQSRIVRAPPLPAGVTGEVLQLDDDDHDFDNRIHRVPPEAEHLTVLYLGLGAKNDPDQPLYYLERAFSETRQRTIEVVARAADASDWAPDGTVPALVVVAEPVPENRIESLRDYLDNGGTMLVVLTTIEMGGTLAQLAGQESVALEEVAPDNPGDYAMLGEIDFTHRIFAPFADPRFSDFTRMHFWSHRRIADDALADARTLARFEDGDPALMEKRVGAGALFVLTSGWHRADSEFARSTKFVPMLMGLIEYNRDDGGRLATAYSIGDTVALPESIIRENGPVTVRTPDGSTLEVGDDETSFTKTDRPGIYTIAAGSRTVRFAVNLAAAESETAPLPQETLESHGVAVVSDATTTAVDNARHRRLMLSTELERQQTLWRWLIVAALVVLILETGLAGRAGRPTPAVEGA